jgi:hypothetical protein
MDRAPGSYPGGCRFKSYQAHHYSLDGSLSGRGGIGRRARFGAEFGMPPRKVYIPLRVQISLPAPLFLYHSPQALRAIFHLTQGLRYV